MKIKKTFIAIVLIAVLMALMLCPVALNTASADDGVETETVQTVDRGEGIEHIADTFIEYLKERYGDDYEHYYTQIIENWGSVEAYLLTFGEKLPEKRKTSWQKFVGWLREYASVWAPPFAVAMVIIVALIGKKHFDKIIERIVNAKLKPIVGELNKQSKATVSILHSQKALLGSVPKFTDNVKELEESEKELANG